MVRRQPTLACSPSIYFSSIQYIAEEGVDQLDMAELEQAAEERGM